MAYCRRCGKRIRPQYVLCYDCNLFSETYEDENRYSRFRDSDRLVHRSNAERKLGRPLGPGEVVHHMNRDKTDNRPSNLWVFPNQDEHDRVHYEDGDFDDDDDDLEDEDELEDQLDDDY